MWAEVAGLGRELAGLGSFEGAAVQARVAMVLSWPNWWALEGGAKPANDLHMLDQLAWMYRPLYNNGTTIDFCRPDEPLGRYDAVIVPSLYLLTEAEGANLVSFVSNGGTAVISFWSGIVDEHDAVYLGPYGGPLRPLMGCDVLEVAPLRTKVRCSRWNGRTGPGRQRRFGLMWRLRAMATSSPASPAARGRGGRP